MNRFMVIATVVTLTLLPAAGQAGIFGRRWSQPAQSYPATGYVNQPSGSYSNGYYWSGNPSNGYGANMYRSNSYRSNSYRPSPYTMPFDSRADPRDWKESHRGYETKVRGW
jgi:hypothetical protein